MTELNAPKREDVLRELLELINRERGSEPGGEGAVGADASLLEGGGLESMQLLQLVSHLEETYRIEIGVENMLPTNFATPDVIVEMIMRLAEERSE